MALQLPPIATIVVSICPFQRAILGIAAEVGGLCTALLSSSLDGNTDAVETALIRILQALWKASLAFDVNFVKVLEGKLAINEMKYPVRLCMVRVFAILPYRYYYCLT
jgi:hypothetical protein